MIGQTGKANAYTHLLPLLSFHSKPTSGNSLIRAKYCVTQQQHCEIRLTHSGPTGSVWMCSHKATGEKGLLWWAAEPRVLLSLRLRVVSYYSLWKKPSSRTTAWAGDNTVPLTPPWLHLPNCRKAASCFVSNHQRSFIYWVLSQLTNLQEIGLWEHLLKSHATYGFFQQFVHHTCHLSIRFYKTAKHCLKS